jgi:deoxyribonuclease-1
MHDRYNLPLKKDTLEILKSWNKEDPPSQQEIMRNDRIEKIQGNRNPYIDDPTLGDKLSVK